MYGVISKEAGLPDMADIQFDVAWRGFPYWSMSIYSNDPHNPQMSAGYLLNFGGNNVNIEPVSRGAATTPGSVSMAA